MELDRQLPVGLTKQLSLSPREREEVGRGEGGGLYDVYVSEEGLVGESVGKHYLHTLLKTVAFLGINLFIMKR